MNEAKRNIINGLWRNNSSLVQLLGLCPLLAVSNTATNAFGLGLVTALVLVFTNTVVSTIRRWIPGETRILIYVMIIVSVASPVQMLINVYVFSLYQSLGIFISLIVANCIVIGRPEPYASQRPSSLTALDSFAIGLSSTCALFLIGALRELLFGNGTLHRHAVFAGDAAAQSVYRSKVYVGEKIPCQSMHKSQATETDQICSAATG